MSWADFFLSQPPAYHVASIQGKNCPAAREKATRGSMLFSCQHELKGLFTLTKVDKPITTPFAI